MIIIFNYLPNLARAAVRGATRPVVVIGRADELGRAVIVRVRGLDDDILVATTDSIMLIE